MTSLAPERTEVPTSPKDEINRRILEVSEDQIKGFARNPMAEIARRAGLETITVIERIQAMLSIGVIRRVRQTMLATNLAQGALIAWKITPDKLDAAFALLSKEDPFSGHVVIRNSESGVTEWPLWTTIKVPKGFSLEKHCDWIRDEIGAEKYRIMPTIRQFALGVGHMRRRNMTVGEKADQPAMDMIPAVVDLDDRDWRVLVALKRDLAVDEVSENVWQGRAREAGVGLEEFFEVAESLDKRGVIGRFSTFLEHTKPVGDASERLSSFNGLFHWAVPKGKEIEAGREIGRFRDPHPLLLARWRAGVEQRQHLRRRARGDEGTGHGPQGRDRRVPRRQRHRPRLHERLLGRPRRDQAERDRPGGVSEVGRRARPDLKKSIARA